MAAMTPPDTTTSVELRSGIDGAVKSGMRNFDTHSTVSFSFLAIITSSFAIVRRRFILRYSSFAP